MLAEELREMLKQDRDVLNALHDALAELCLTDYKTLKCQLEDLIDEFDIERTEYYKSRLECAGLSDFIMLADV